MNIYEKLQECRVQLKNKNLKQTGLNKFSNYTYFELGDFLPAAMEIMNGLKLTSVFDFGSEESSLFIIDAEKPEDQIVFSSPSIISELKGSNPLQNIGAAQTYMRRYLYIMALELSEFDPVNQTNPDENDEEMERQKILNRKVNEIELEAFEQAVIETQSDVPALFKVMKFNGSPEEMTFAIWKQAMEKIEKKREKMAKEKPQTNLDL